MIEELLDDIIKESEKKNIDSSSQQQFIETILENIYQFLYKSGQPIHTIAIGILRGNTFDMYYKGRILDKFAEMFGAMSYDTTIAGRACELYKTKNKDFLNLNSRKKIKEEFEIASNELEKNGLIDEANSLRKRASSTIDQGIGSFLLIPICFGKKIIGIFTLSSVKESDKNHILGVNIKENFLPITRMLSLILYMEKISYDKAEEMGRLLISSIDGKDEYQATHSLNVRSMIDIFIDEISRDKDLRERIEAIGFKLTVERIERLRLAALLHDMGKVFVPSKILRKHGLNKEELLVRKMHSYCTYNILNKSNTLKDIANIASLHHARYYIPNKGFEKGFIGYPFDRLGQNSFSPESQIIALADTINSIVRARPGRKKGLDLTQALDIIENEEHKFHSGLKDIFLIIIRRVQENLTESKYPREIANEYSSCLWLDDNVKKIKNHNKKWNSLHKFIKKIDYNHIGIVCLMNYNNASFLLKENIKLDDKNIVLKKIEKSHILLSIINIPKEEGFIWIDKIFNLLKNLSFDGKIAFAFVGKHGVLTDIQNIFNCLSDGLEEIKNEPVHYFLNPDMFKIE